MDRYPGIVPFSSEQSKLFFGRQTEEIELLRLIVLYKLVVLFGKSGTGKSSLLQAGVFPLLPTYHIQPIFIRLNQKDSQGDFVPSHEQIYLELVDKGLLPVDTPPGLTLWEYFNRISAQQSETPLLVFDQFEELFTLHTEAGRASFISQLAGVISGVKAFNPSSGDDFLEDLPANDFLVTPPDIRFVFSIRSDYLYLLDQLSYSIPTILLCRYELPLLSLEETKEAIKGPAELDEHGFSSESFTYSEASLDMICSELSKQQSSEGPGEQSGEIEPFQLQLLCTAIEKKIIQERHPKGFVVEPDFFGKQEGIQKVLNEFFNTILKHIPAAKRNAVINVLGKALLKNKRRVILDENTINSDYNVSPTTLKYLTDSRLLRKETRQGATYYEISHDTLIDPIASEYRKLRIKRIRRNIIVGTILGSLAIAGAAVAAIWFFHQKEVAQSAQFSLNSFIVRGEGQVALANLLAVEAITKEVNPLSEKTIQQALSSSPHLKHILYTSGDVASLAISPDNKLLLAGAYDGTVQLWDIASQSRLNSLTGHAGIVYSVAISADGSQAVSGDDSGRMILWDLKTGKQRYHKQDHQGEIWAIAFSADGKRIYSGGNDKTLRVYNTQTGRPMGKLLDTTAHKGIIWCLSVSPDGNYLAAGLDASIEVWETQTGKPFRSLTGGHTSYISAINFSVDGRQLVSGSDDRTLGIWEVKTGRLTKKIPAHREAVWGVAFSRDGRQVVSASNDRTIRLWDVKTGNQIGNNFEGHQGAVLCMGAGLDRQLIATGAKDHTIRLWSIQLQGQLGEPLVGHTNIVHSVRFSPDGRQLVSGSEDKTAILWRTDGTKIKPLSGHTEAVWGVDYSRDGRYIATGSFDLTIRLWDGQTGNFIREFKHNTHDWIREIAFSPNGNYLAAVCSDNLVFLWDVKTGDTLRTLKGHSSSVVSVAFSPDSRRLVTGSYDRSIRLWEVASGQEVGKPWLGHENYVWSVAFSPDGKLVASGSDDGSIRLWDAQTGSPVGKPIWGTVSRVYSVAFSPNGRHLASGSSDQTVRVWDVASQVQVGQPYWGHTGEVRSVVFSPDGKLLGSGSEDKTVRLWRAPRGEAKLSSPTMAMLKRQACELANRSLSKDEWVQYIGDEASYDPQCKK